MLAPPWWRKSNVVIAAIVALGLALGMGAGLVLATKGAKRSAAETTPIASPANASSTSLSLGPPCPLSGVSTRRGTVPQRPAVAIKVDNYPDARPQSGLDKADVVFEEPVEGGITRLVAVFQCNQAPLIGPIRSAREPDVAIIDELSRPIFVHVGGIDPIIALINSANDDNLDCCQSSIIEHVPGRYAPFDTYTSTSAIWGLYPARKTPPSPIFTYSRSVSGVGAITASARIPFSSTNDNTWQWNPAAGQWMLSIGGTAATLLGGGQIGVTNVVIMTVDTWTGPWVENSEGAHEVEVDPTSGGPVEVLRNGVSISGTWSRSSISQPARLEGSDGTPITLAPGETWVEMVPSGIPVTTTP